MKQCGYDSVAQGKPCMKTSGEKATAICAANPELQADRTARVNFDPRTVPEEQIVAVIRGFYARSDLSPQDKRKHVSSQALQPMWGTFEFSKFGQGPLIQFLEKHGFESKGHIEKMKKAGNFSRARKTNDKRKREEEPLQALSVALLEK